MTISQKEFESLTGKAATFFLPRLTSMDEVQSIEKVNCPIRTIARKFAACGTIDGANGMSSWAHIFFGITRENKVLTTLDGSNINKEVRAMRGIEKPLIEAWGKSIFELKYVIEYHYELRNWKGADVCIEKMLILYVVSPMDVVELRARAIYAIQKASLRKLLEVGLSLDLLH